MSLRNEYSAANGSELKDGAVPNIEKRVAEIKQQFGSSDNASKEYFDKVVRFALDIWNRKFKQNDEITKKQFIEGIENILNYSSNYLHGLDSSHLAKLFDLYVLNQKNPLMNVNQFCHSFTYFMRETIFNEVEETTFSCTIDLLYTHLELLKKLRVIFMARSDVTELLKSESIGNNYFLYFSEARVEVYRNMRVSYGLNLMMATYNSNTDFVEHLQLISSMPSQPNGKGYFLDIDREPHFNLNFIETTAARLLQQQATPLYFLIKTPEEKEQEAQNVDYSEAAEDEDIRKLIAIMGARLNQKQSLSVEEKEEIPSLIKNYLTNPAHLEEYTSEEFSKLIVLGRLPNKIIGDYLGQDPVDIAKMLTDNPHRQKVVVTALRNLRTRLVALADNNRKKSKDHAEDKLTELLMTDIEHPELDLFNKLGKLSEIEKARCFAVVNQYWNAGYYAIHQSEAALYRIIETHFNHYQIKPEAATCVFSGLVPLSSNAVPVNPLCWMHDVILQKSLGMHSTVATFVKGGINLKVMTHLGLDTTEYQKFFAKMTTERLSKTNDTAKFDETKGVEATHVGAAHVVTQTARQAMLDGVFKYLPTPEPFLVPDDQVIIFVSSQVDDWMDFMIKESKGDYIDWRQHAPLKNQKGEIVVMHSRDFKTPAELEGNIIEYDKNRRQNSRHDYNQILVYVPQQPGSSPSHHHIAAAAYSGTFKKNIRQACYAFMVKPTKKEVDNLLSYLIVPGNQYDNNFNQSRLEASRLVKKLTTGIKPFFALPSTEPYADAEAWGFEPLSIYYDGQKTYVNVWGLPLQFPIKATGVEGGTVEFCKFIQDVDRANVSPHNVEQRKILSREAKKQESKAVPIISIDEIAVKHDLLRSTTAQLITHKIERKEQEKFLFNPALLCYQKVRQQIMKDTKTELMGCYVKTELEKEMTGELNLKDFYEYKFNLDVLTSKLDPAQCYRIKLYESIKKLAQNKMTESKEIIQNLSEENDHDMLNMRNIQADLTLKLKDFCDHEAKERETRQALAAKAEKEASDRKESPTEREARLKIESTKEVQYLADRKEELAKTMHITIKQMTADILGKIEKIGHPFNDPHPENPLFISEREIKERCLNYLWTLVEIQLQSRCSTALRGLFKNKLPLNETDMTAETIDAKTEMMRLANMDNAILFDCAVKETELADLIQCPDVMAKIGKFTAFTHSLFKVAGQQVSAKAVAQNSRPRYHHRVKRPNI